MTRCPVCQLGAVGRPTDAGERFFVDCDGCGKFEISLHALALINSEPQRAFLSHWIRLACEQGQRVSLDQELTRRILDSYEPISIAEQFDGLILFIGQEVLKIGGSGRLISFKEDRRITALVGASISQGLMFLTRALAEQRLIYPQTINSYNETLSLTFEGWQKFEELRQRRIESRVAFMAMPFNQPLLDKVFQQYKSAVAQTGFQLRRIIDSAPAGLIDNRLRVEIRKSRFMVCELTERNPGAYWEGGFAEGLGRPVIYSCEKAAFTSAHFDTNHCHTVLWVENDLHAAAENLKATIRATLPNEAQMSDSA